MSGSLLSIATKKVFCLWTEMYIRMVKDLCQPALCIISIEDFSKDCPGTRYGASPARNDCNVLASRLICYLFFDFGGPRSLFCSSLFQ